MNDLEKDTSYFIRVQICLFQEIKSIPVHEYQRTTSDIQSITEQNGTEQNKILQRRFF